MRILWISTIPCGANTIINPKMVLSGWLGSLEDALTKVSGLELHECYLCNKPVEEFVHNGVYNYPVFDSFYSSRKYFIFSQLAILFGRLFSDRRIKMMEDVISRVNPDLIHIHGTESELGLLTTRIKDIPIVISIQGIINPIQNKQYSGIPYEEVSKRDSFLKLITLHSSHYGIKGWGLYKDRECVIFRNVKYLIGRTDWDRRVSSVLAPQAKYYHGGEILRQPFYCCNPWNKTEYGTPFTIVSIITNGLFKGFETILRAAFLLSNISFAFKWIIIGQSENSPNTSLFEDYTKIKCKDVNIELVGSKTADQIVSLLQNADLYCQTSHIENSPNSVCEAMMLGMPVIASMAGGTDSIVDHKHNGLLFQEGEYFSLAGLIIELSKHFDEAKRMASSAREIALCRHNPSEIGMQYMNTYTSIIKEFQR